MEESGKSRFSSEVGGDLIPSKKAAQPGKKKVIRRLVKNAKTGEIIKTEIVRVDSNGETTVTSYPAGSQVPSLELNKPLLSAQENTLRKSDIGPSVPVNVSGIDDLLEQERALTLSGSKKVPPPTKKSQKELEESLESTMITIMKSKRNREPKSRKRGLVASTMPGHQNDGSKDNKGGDFVEDTDYRNIAGGDVCDDEAHKKRQEKHRRRREKKIAEDGFANKSQVFGVEDLAKTVVNDDDDDEELYPLEEAELMAKQIQKEKKLQIDNQPVTQNNIKTMAIKDEDDVKKQKEKKKHKKKKEKKKKTKRKKDSDVEDISQERERSPIIHKHMDFETKTTNVPQHRSRSRSFSSMSLSSISSSFSDSFDFAQGDFKMTQPENFDNALGEYQRTRGMFPLRGRGMFDPYLRGGRGFRGYPNLRGRGRSRGNFRGRGRGDGSSFIEPSPGMMGAIPGGPGRGGRGMWRGGVWVTPGWGRGGPNNMEEPGIGIYVEEDSDDNKRKHRSDSSSYTSSYSSRSRSRHRRRRRHKSSSRSYSSYSRSYSRSYTRSYSSRSYSRSYSRSTSRSYSSRSRSRSWSSSSRSNSRKPARWSSEEEKRFDDVYNVGANTAITHNEEVPWWAEFDKTYELKKKDKNGEVQSDVKKNTSKQVNSSDEMEVVRCTLQLVNRVCKSQSTFSAVAEICLKDLINKITSVDEEVQFCLDGILDQVCLCENLQNLSPTLLKLVPNIKHADQQKLTDCYNQAHVFSSQQTAVVSTNTARSSRKDVSESKRHSHRRRKRRYTRSRSTSSSESEKRQSLVNLTSEQQESLQQAQQMLIMQQKQLQAAGILPPSLIIPSLATITGSALQDGDGLNAKWDKDIDAKMKSKDELTRKVMQRMKEKKIHADDDMSPTFLSRNQLTEATPTDKIFSGSGNLKSRKIAISIDGSKVLNKFDDVLLQADESEESLGYTKKDIIAASQSALEDKQIQRDKSQEQREKLEAWSDEQKILKDEVKRQMREEIEKAERAKKAQMREEILEQEKQREIIRIREEVRQQIRKEIQEEIEKQRKQVLDNAEIKNQIMELETLKKSVVHQVDPKVQNSPGLQKEEAKGSDDFLLQQDKHKQDMNRWLQQNGKTAAEMDVEEMRKMQVIYMQQLHHWSQQQQQAYMQWYWHQRNHHQQHQNIQRKHEMFPHQTSSVATTSFAPTKSIGSKHQSGLHTPSVPPHSTHGHHSQLYHSRILNGQNLRMPSQVFQHRYPPARVPQQFHGNLPHPHNYHGVSQANASRIPEKSAPQLNVSHISHPHPQINMQVSYGNAMNVYPGQHIQTNESVEERAPGTTPPPGGETQPQQTVDQNAAFHSTRKQNDDLNEREMQDLNTKKKKKKKHRKHKKRKENSSSSSDDAENEKEKIMKQLVALQNKQSEGNGGEGEVEDGEVESENETKLPSLEALTSALLELEKKKKKRKREKKKKKSKNIPLEPKEDNSMCEEAHQPNRNVQGIPSNERNLIQPPSFFQEINPGYPGNPNKTSSRVHTSQQSATNAGDISTPFMPSPHSGHMKSNPNLVSLGGASGKMYNTPVPTSKESYEFAQAEAQETYRYGNPTVGPAGDHIPKVFPGKQLMSPLPMIIPNDPHELEAWNNEMEQKYAVPSQTTSVGQPYSQSFMGATQLDPQAMHTTSLNKMENLNKVSRRARERTGGRGRGRKRRRLQRNYYDWDQPVDDGLVYYYSESGSSGWGSDKDFDDLLAKKKWETGTTLPPPTQFENTTVTNQHADRSRTGMSPLPQHPQHVSTKFQSMGEPQGIPVIGGIKPQPIPSLANRSMQHYSPRQDMGISNARDHLYNPHIVEQLGIPSEMHNIHGNRHTPVFNPPAYRHHSHQQIMPPFLDRPYSRERPSGDGFGRRPPY